MGGGGQKVAWALEEWKQRGKGEGNGKCGSRGL